MAYALVSGVVASPVGGGASPTTTAIDTTGADLLIIAAAHASWGSVGTVSDSKSNTWTALTTRNSDAGSIRLLYCQNPTVGSGHTFTTTGTFSSIGAVGFSGSTSSPFDTGRESGAAVNAGTSVQPGSITPSVDGALIISVTSFANEGVTSLTINSGFTEAFELPTGAGQYYGVALSYLIQTTAAAVNPTITLSATGYGATELAAFKPGGGGPSFIARAGLNLIQSIHRASVW